MGYSIEEIRILRNGNVGIVMEFGAHKIVIGLVQNTPIWVDSQSLYQPKRGELVEVTKLTEAGPERPGYKAIVVGISPENIKPGNFGKFADGKLTLNPERFSLEANRIQLRGFVGVYPEVQAEVYVSYRVRYRLSDENANSIQFYGRDLCEATLPIAVGEEVRTSSPGYLMFPDFLYQGAGKFRACSTQRLEGEESCGYRGEYWDPQIVNVPVIPVNTKALEDARTIVFAGLDDGGSVKGPYLISLMGSMDYFH